MKEQSGYHRNPDGEELCIQKGGRKVVFFDGDCGLCARGVQFCFRRDLERQLWYASLGSEFAKEYREKLQLPASGLEADTFVFWQADLARKDERSDAALQLGLVLGGRWALLARIGYLVPKIIRDWGYNQVARNRRRFFPQGSECSLNADLKRRFLP